MPKLRRAHSDSCTQCGKQALCGVGDSQTPVCKDHLDAYLESAINRATQLRDLLAMDGVWSCVGCGCTDLSACVVNGVPCRWVKEPGDPGGPLCSRCDQGARLVGEVSLEELAAGPLADQLLARQLRAAETTAIADALEEIALAPKGGEGGAVDGRDWDEAALKERAWSLAVKYLAELATGNTKVQSEDLLLSRTQAICLQIELQRKLRRYGIVEITQLSARPGRFAGSGAFRITMRVPDRRVNEPGIPS